ncbi:MAG: aminotransferase class IV, partial [Coriobacteriia bacterium]|nr:aminotransferase class IV [Coriobacteriia bacterium]
FAKEDGTLVVPQSHTDSILPSITRRSLIYVAENMLGMKVENRPVKFEEVPEFVECGLCGTAAVISAVGEVHHGDETIVFKNGHDEMGPIMTKLRSTLTGIQSGEIEGPEGWVVKIC